jgi:hypothetical protein
MSSRHPEHHIVPYSALAKWRDAHDPDNMDALCCECPEFRGAGKPHDVCSDTCGSANVYVSAVTFVKMRLEGLV